MLKCVLAERWQSHGSWRSRQETGSRRETGSHTPECVSRQVREGERLEMNASEVFREGATF